MTRSTATLLAPALLISGCLSVREPYTPPEPANYSGDSWNVPSASQPLDPKELAQWWTVLNDPTLNELISKVAESNLDLRTAEAQVRKARAQRAQVIGSFMPSIAATGGAVRSRESRNVGPGVDATLYSAGFDASWEIDIFGAKRAQADTAMAELESVEESRRNVLVSVLAETALTYTDLRSLQRRQTITQSNLDAQRESLKITQAKEEAGAVTPLDTDRARTIVAQTEASLPELTSQIEQTMNRLAVLTGVPPGSLRDTLSTPSQLAAPPPQIAVGVPAEVLRRRPDVRLAERRLAAETYRIGVTRSELYPKLTLSGTIGLESLSPSTLLSKNSRMFGIGPGLHWNIFSGGRIRKEIEAQSAQQEIAMIDYERTILNALEEVENAITSFAQEQIRLSSLKTAEASAVDAMKLASARYEAGASDYLAVLDAQRTRLNAEDQSAISSGQVVLNLIRLYKALGGGWDPTPPLP